MMFELRRRQDPPDMIRWQQIGEAVESIMNTDGRLLIWTNPDGSVTAHSANHESVRGQKLVEVLTEVGGR